MKGTKNIYARDIHQDNRKMEVFLFNVGQGDHMMLKFPTMEYGIIDFHYDSAEGIPEPPCLSYFKALKKELPEEEFSRITISFFCISHTDKDHIKGITETIKWFHDNNIFIKDFWMGAARDESQLMIFLKEKIPAVLKKIKFHDRVNLVKKIESFSTGMDDFVHYFRKWKRRGFGGARYGAEAIGTGEYLIDIRTLRRPCSMSNIKAINMGPLGTQIDAYINNLTLDIVKNILGASDEDSQLDKNLLSHILRIKFGDTNLIFGGDTHKVIWEECLDKYEDRNFSFLEDMGSYSPRFIKVSHHGSRNSSSTRIWEKLLSDKSHVFLGISAGRNKKFGHPHAETISEIRQVKNDSQIFATNICTQCLVNSSYPKEIHAWYDDFITENRHAMTRSGPGKIVRQLLKTTRSGDTSFDEENNMGLFAYIFEIPENIESEIKVKIALAKSIKGACCFYNSHWEKPHKDCKG